MIKLLIGTAIRAAITFAITFLATRHAIGHEVAEKLNSGDTVSLWAGQIPLSTNLIASSVSSAALPILLPIVQGTWGRVKLMYQIAVARANQYAMSSEQLKTEVSNASTAEILKTVSQNA